MKTIKVSGRTPTVALALALALALAVPGHALERQIYPPPEQATSDMVLRSGPNRPTPLGAKMSKAMRS